MLRRTLLPIALTILILFLGVRTVQAVENARPPTAPLAAPVSMAFTYQGFLNDGGSPADGDYDFLFKLFNAASGDLQVGSDLEIGDVAVSAGYFTVELDFGGVFDGTALWLEVAVRPGASTSGYQQLLPRQPLTAAPFASFASHAPWGGLSGVPAGFADGTDDDTTYSPGNQLGLAGTTFNVEEGSGSGLDADLLDGQHGSYYRDASNLNAGTLNNARFSAYSDLGAEGYLDNNASSDLITRAQADVRYWNASNLSTGTLSTSRYSAYSDLSDDGYLDNSTGSDILTRNQADLRYINVGETKTEYLSINPSAFTGVCGDCDPDYTKGVGYLCYDWEGTNSYATLVAPVYIPNGAMVIEFEMFYLDALSSSIVGSLYRADSDGTSQMMASCESSALPLPSSCIDTTISYSAVDNAAYSYGVLINPPPFPYNCDSYKVYRILITYTNEW